MHPNLKKEYYTFEEYLAIEQAEGIRYQYYDGEFFAMAGGSKRHNRITYNTRRVIEDEVAERPCEVYSENVKLELQKNKYYVYPDVMLTCDEDDPNDDQESIIKNPALIVEVLLASTQEYDDNEKRHKYFKLKSLQYYILIKQEQARVEVYEKHADFWKYQHFEQLEDVIYLEKLNISLSLKDIYQKVSFGENDKSEI